ncbi:PREDICTED: uncharacterized protein LOC101306970 [Fragaria vesca subsp. vesca]
MVMHIAGRAQSCVQSKRYLLPSGPIGLPVIIFALAKGHRINTTFPLSSIGPAILQLVQISALAFANGGDNDIKYVFFEASTISGILHASMYLDAVVLHYYTGLDALVKSTFSGECPSCVCRNEDLVVGGTLVSYRGWGLTTFLVVATLCWRVISMLYGRKLGKFILVSAGEFKLDLGNHRLCLSLHKFATREVDVASCCFRRHTCFDLPLCNQRIMHLFNTSTLCIKVGQRMFATEAR